MLLPPSPASNLETNNNAKLCEKAKSKYAITVIDCVASITGLLPILSDSLP